MITDAELNKLAEEWVTFNKSWDHYECDWINSGVDTFKAGYRAAEAKLVAIINTINQQMPEGYATLDAEGYVCMINEGQVRRVKRPAAPEGESK